MSGSATDAPDRPLQEQIAVTLEQMIRSREIQPGQLMLEVRVAQAFGVSRSPARLALQLCVERGGQPDHQPVLQLSLPTVEHFIPLFLTLGAATNTQAPVQTTIAEQMMGLPTRSFQVS